MTIEEMKQKKKELGYTYEQIALLSGLPLGTVQKALGGITKTPRHETIKALEAVFCSSNQINQIGEPASAYQLNRNKKPGEYTVNDYLAWPEDERIELIDGVIYDMAVPVDTHQIVLLEIAYQIRQFIRSNEGKCLPIISPVDVQLDQDDKTMVQPDFIIVCDSSKRKNGRIFGAPDFVVEILSPSTWKKDTVKKLSKYMNAGVKEYWVIDHSNEQIIVYTNSSESGIQVTLYNSFEYIVPVSIYDGKCEVNFQEIKDYLNRLEQS